MFPLGRLIYGTRRCRNAFEPQREEVVIIMYRVNETLQRFPAESLYRLAGSEQTPRKVLVALAGSEWAHVRRRVAENPQVPITILAMLASDRDSEVRIAVSDNPASPAGLVLVLAADANADVRYAIAENAHTPLPILRLLVEDDNPYVSNRAAVTLSRLDTKMPRAAA